MILGLDTETQGLNTDAYLQGCLCTEHHECYLYDNAKQIMYDLIEKGKQEKRNKRLLKVWAHNMEYDFYAIQAYRDEFKDNIEIWSFRPFIAVFKTDEGEKIIEFKDTMNLYPRMSLEQVGEVLGYEKLDTPDKLKTEEKQEYTTQEWMKICQYLKRDTKIVVKAVQSLKDELREEFYCPRRLYTISQISISGVMKKLQDKSIDGFWYNKDKRQAKHTDYSEEIHKGYRGGRIEAKSLGEKQVVDYYDVNSLYPYMATQIPFPDVSSEQKMKNPNDSWVLNSDIGVAKCVLKNESDDIGCLPVRTPIGNYFPKTGSKIYGVYTTKEIQYAVRNGWELVHCDWLISWRELDENPLGELYSDMYDTRKKYEDEDDDMKSWLYKMMMNSSIGKMAQYKPRQFHHIDSVEEVEDYIERGWEAVKGLDLDYVYKKEEENPRKKNYYVPIIPTYINAFGRLLLHKKIQEVGHENFYYCDTDSIICDSNVDGDLFEVNDELGGWDKEHESVEFLSYGHKTYCVGEDVKISGVSSLLLSKDDFKQGLVKNKTMRSLKQADSKDEVGHFTVEERDLTKQVRDTRESKEKLRSQRIYIDGDTNSISSEATMYLKKVTKG